MIIPAWQPGIALCPRRLTAVKCWRSSSKLFGDVQRKIGGEEEARNHAAIPITPIKRPHPKRSCIIGIGCPTKLRPRTIRMDCTAITDTRLGIQGSDRAPRRALIGLHDLGAIGGGVASPWHLAMGVLIRERLPHRTIPLLPLICATQPATTGPSAGVALMSWHLLLPHRLALWQMHQRKVRRPAAR